MRVELTDMTPEAKKEWKENNIGDVESFKVLKLVAGPELQVSTAITVLTQELKKTKGDLDVIDFYAEKFRGVLQSLLTEFYMKMQKAVDIGVVVEKGKKAKEK